MAIDYPSEALAAAARSAAGKSSSGNNATDLLMDPGDVNAQVNGPKRTDLTTDYMGLQLRNPIVASAGPLSKSVESMQELEEAGVGAIVMYSLFAEQLLAESSQMFEQTLAHAETYAEATSYFPSTSEDVLAEKMSERHFKLLEAGANALQIPLIASLNGVTKGSWTDAARRMQDAGAAAIELNVHFVPGDVSMTGVEVRERHVEILESVKSVVSVPVAMKLSPYFSSFGEVAVTLVHAGANGLVLFDRFLQPDIDIARCEVVPMAGLSTPDAGRLPRTWAAVLRGHVGASLALTGGVETAEDVVKGLLAGADVVMTTSSLLRHGAAYATQLIDGLRDYLRNHNFSLDDVRGRLAVPKDVSASDYERAGYVAALNRTKSY